jgi:hypothetical protein
MRLPAAIVILLILRAAAAAAAAAAPASEAWVGLLLVEPSESDDVSVNQIIGLTENNDLSKATVVASSSGPITHFSPFEVSSTSTYTNSMASMAFVEKRHVVEVLRLDFLQLNPITLNKNCNHLD